MSKHRSENSIRQHLARLSPEKRRIFEQLRLASLVGVEEKPPRTARLSSAQERLWFLDRLTPNSAFYTIDLASRLGIAIDVNAFRLALNEIVRRHEILRTSFIEHDGNPAQHIAASLDLPCQVNDLRFLPFEARETEAMRLAATEAQLPFDLARLPLLRTSLIQLDESDFLFLLNIHHIVADGWSLQVFASELTILYTAFEKGEASPLPDLPLQFADYAEREREFLGARAAGQLAYWTRQLADLPVLTLPSDHPRPSLPSRHGLRRFVDISQGVTKRLDALAREERTTLYVILVTAFAILLHRYSGENDLVIGTPVAGRHRADMEGLIGCFINTLVLRADLSGNPTVREAVNRMRGVVIEALANQHVALETLVRELHVTRDLSRNPLFQVTFQLYQEPGQPGPRGKPVVVQKGTTQMDLAMDLFQSQAGLTGTIEYSTDLFEPLTIERMIGQFRALLEAIVDDPDQPVSRLRILNAWERRLIIEDWNATSVTYPFEGGVHELVSRQSAGTPAAQALLCEEKQMTFDMLERRSNQLANLLCEKGIRRGACVGILLERSINLPVVLIAILKAGGAYVALDPFSPRDRLGFQIHDSSPAAIVTDSVLLGKLPDGPYHLVCLDTDSRAIDDASQIAPNAGVQLSDPAYVVYTSGSTGVPKGVLISHGAFLNHMRWFQEAFPLSESDRMLHKYSIGFDVAAVEIFAPLIAGAGVVVAPPGAHLDVDLLLSQIAQNNVTAIDVVPSQLALYVEHPAFRECCSLRRITCGGEVLSPALAERVLAFPNIELHNIYGPTETTISATWWTCRRGQLPPILPVGRPISNLRAYILDPDASPVPIGVAGELVLGGAGVAIGYLNAPELTAAKFVPDPFDSRAGARMYKTGDRARFLPDGNIEFLGRLDTQVKIRGFRVEPSEIEAVLASHPSVDSCAVTVRADALGEPQLVAHIAYKSEPELWPSVGEHSLYDPLLYYAMTNDTLRNEKYRIALAHLVRGKTVVDVGTGSDALLARFAVEAGARRVYAIEMLEESYRAASDLIATLGLADRIQLVFGDARQVSLPEPADVCVSELLGMIASSEGAAVILSDALRFLKPHGVMIPSSSATHIAALSLPERLRLEPRFTQISGAYVQKVFERVGFPFDVRICIDHARRSWLVSDTGVFESLNFATRIPNESHMPVTLRVTRDGYVDGFLLWLTAETIAGQVIDVLEDEYHWLPVFFPVFTPSVSVTAGDTFELLCSVIPSAGQITPDYRVTGRLLRRGAPPLDVYYESPHTRRVFRGNGFYETLFANGFEERFVEPASKIDAGALKAYLSRTLPDYMLPGRFTSVGSMPLTAAGKIDRLRLPAPERERTIPGAPGPPQTDLERIIVEIWQDLLGLETVGVTENFFDLGGHSLLVIRVQSRLREQLKRELTVVDLFRYPTVSSLAGYLATRPPVAYATASRLE